MFLVCALYLLLYSIGPATSVSDDKPLTYAKQYDCKSFT